MPTLHRNVAARPTQALRGKMRHSQDLRALRIECSVRFTARFFHSIAGMLRIAFAVLLAVHGAIHAIGFVKAFGLAEVVQLEQPISQPLGMVWLAAGLGFVAGAVLLLVSPRHWWIAAAAALLASTIAVVMSWSDANLGMIANLIVLVPLALPLLDLRSSSFRSIYQGEVERGLSRSAATPHITEADLAPLPLPVQKYLRRVGVLGQPRVHDFRARFKGTLRSGPDATWMTIRAEQHSFFDEPSRIFLVEASLYGIPFEALHVYVGPSATMRVRVASIFDVADVSGPEMNQSETVTLFNDMCLLAPASLVDAKVKWREIDARSVEATFTNADNTISAVLSFDAQGDLVNFVSNDRYQSDGKTHERFPWVTPVEGYRDFHGVRLAARAEARWQEPEGEWTYARFELEDIEYNVRGAAALRRIEPLHVSRPIPMW